MFLASYYQKGKTINKRKNIPTRCRRAMVKSQNATVPKPANSESEENHLTQEKYPIPRLKNHKLTQNLQHRNIKCIKSSKRENKLTEIERRETQVRSFMFNYGVAA